MFFCGGKKIAHYHLIYFLPVFTLYQDMKSILPHVKDHKGRFLASESIAFKSGFLELPVVDIWAYKFKELVIDNIFPELILHRIETRTVHTLVHAGHPLFYQK